MTSGKLSETPARAADPSRPTKAASPAAITPCSSISATVGAANRRRVGSTGLSTRRRACGARVTARPVPQPAFGSSSTRVAIAPPRAINLYMHLYGQKKQASTVAPRGTTPDAVPWAVHGLHLCEAAVHKQFRSRDVAAVVGGQTNPGPA